MKKLIGIVFLLSAILLSAQTENVTIHTVAPGETLYSIARIYNVSTSSILLSNGISDKEVKLQLNQKLKIPSKNLTTNTFKSGSTSSNELIKNQGLAFSREGDLLIHTVQKGETFYSIIRNYKVLAYDVISVNNLPNTLVKEGQKLILPSNAVIPDGNVLSSTSSSKEVLIEKNETIVKPSIADKSLSTKTTTKVDESVKLNGNTEKTTHIIVKGETLYAIARTYGVSPGELIKINNIKGDQYKLGQVLIIPTRIASSPKVIKETVVQVVPPVETVKEVMPTDTKVTEEITKQEKDVVKKEESARPIKKNTAKQKEKPKETDIAIETMEEAKIAIEKKDMEIIKDHEKEAEAVSVPKVINKSTESATTKPETKRILSPDDYGNVFAGYAQNGLTMKKSRGTAIYLSESTVGNPSLALYNGADIGSILKVTNLMNKKFTYVKVIGRIPGTESSTALLKVSSKVAEQLNVLDETFLVEVSSFAKN